jgi:hypothetical protein
MKTQNTIKFLAVTFLLGIVFTSCQSSEGDVVAQDVVEQFSAVQVQTETEVDNITEDVSSIIDQTFADQEYANKSEENHTNRYLPDCATVTKVITGNSKDVTIDFGDACELRNGNIVSGKIVMHYSNDKTALTKMIDVSFDNFYNNDKKIEGGHSVLKERVNANGNPQSTFTFNVNVTWSDGATASKSGTKIKELIEGNDTPAWGDNVFSISGNWAFTRKDGTVHTSTITTPLRKELACRFIVSGVVTFQKDGQTAVLDYGDGTCDDLGTLTKDGVTETIHLKK